MKFNIERWKIVPTYTKVIVTNRDHFLYGKTGVFYLCDVFFPNPLGIHMDEKICNAPAGVYYQSSAIWLNVDDIEVENGLERVLRELE